MKRAADLQARLKTSVAFAQRVVANGAQRLRGGIGVARDTLARQRQRTLERARRIRQSARVKLFRLRQWSDGIAQRLRRITRTNWFLIVLPIFAALLWLWNTPIAKPDGFSTSASTLISILVTVAGVGASVGQRHLNTCGGPPRTMTNAAGG